MNQLNITIKEPCHENWANMSANEKGRYCGVCEKTVIDFTKKTPVEIKSILEEQTGKVCGRFRTKDLAQPNPVPVPVPVVKPSWVRSKWLAFVAAIATLGFGKKAMAQNMVGQVVSLPQPENKQDLVKSTETILHGQIKSVDKEKGIANAEIRVLSGGKEIVKTVSFSSGAYFVTIPENTIWDFKVTVEYNALGFEASVLQDLPIEKDRIACDVQLAPKLYEHVTMGGISYTHYQEMYPDELKEHVVETRVEYATMGAVSYTSYVNAIEPRYVQTNDSLETKEEIIQPAPLEFSINAFPNPGNGLFNLTINNSEESDIYVFDIAGKIFLQRKTTLSTEVIDLTGAPNGTYIIKVDNPALKQWKHVKVVKMS